MPTPTLQLLSRTIYTTDGITTTWDFSFSDGYLHASHVKAKTIDIDGIEDELSFTLVGQYQISILPALSPGRVLHIYRDTPKTAPLVNFSDGSSLSEVALDTNARQSIMVAAEAADANVGSLTGNALQAASASAASAALSAASALSSQASAELAAVAPVVAPTELSAVKLLLDDSDVFPIVSSSALKRFSWLSLKAWASGVFASSTTLASSSGSVGIGYLPSGTSAVATTVQTALRGVGFWAEQFGAVGNASTDCTTPVLNAITAMRANAVPILDDIGGSTITAYSSGVLNFGPGIFVISADALNITQDLGLTLRGRGSRRTNNAVRAATTLLISGTSSGYGMSVANNGARGFTIEDMDVCYATSGFTGNLIDTINAPGLTFNRVFLGTYGLTGGTRLQTATSLIRSTYDEYHTFNNCVFDGAVDGWWSDDLRVTHANTFGGSVTKFNDCVFYDFTNRPVRHDGLRTRQGLHFNNTVVNPISVDCQRGFDLTNVDGVTLTGGGYAGSVANKAAVEWIRLSNCTGSVQGVFFDDLSKAGTIDGVLEVSGNRIFSTDGLTLKGGVISGKSNEFSKGTTGYTLSPTYPLTVDIGPDLFKSDVTTSYNIPSDSADLGGRINYAANNDASASRFSNTSGRIRVINTDEKTFTVTSTTYTVLIEDTGRTIQATGAANQVFTLPTAVPGTRLSFNKIAGFTLTINCAGGNNFYTGAGAAKTGVSAAAGDIGGTLVLEAYATVGWRVVSQVGTWTYV